MRKHLKIDEKRAVYEFPLFLLFLACLHAGIKNLHDALLDLAERGSLASVLREFSKIAKAYVAIFNVERNHATSIAKLLSMIEIEWLRRFLAGYLVSLTTHGDAMTYIEESAKAALQRVHARTRAGYEHLTMAIEAVTLMSTVLVFTLVFAGSWELVLALSIPISALALLILCSTRMYAAELLIPPPGPLCYLVMVFCLASLAFTIAALNTPSLGLRGALICCTPSTLLATYVYLEWRKVRNHASRAVSALTSVLEVLRVGSTASSSDVLKLLKEDRNVLSQLIYSLRTGHTPPFPVDGPRMALVPFFADIVSTIMRSGIYATRIASMAYEVIVMLEALLKEVDFKALVYEAALALSFIILSVAAGAVGSMLNFSIAAGLGVVSGAAYPTANVGFVDYAVPLSLTVASCAIGIAYAVRGSPAYSMLVPLMPMLVVVSWTITMSVAASLRSILLLP